MALFICRIKSVAYSDQGFHRVQIDLIKIFK